MDNNTANPSTPITAATPMTPAETILQPHQESSFICERAPENWQILAWACCALVLIICALKRYGPHAPGLWGIISRSCRCLAIIGVFVMLAAPAWRTTTYHTQPGRISVIIDQSSSMQRRDAANGQSRISRSSDFYHALVERENPPNNSYHYLGICARGEAIDETLLQENRLTATGAHSNLDDELQRTIHNERADAYIFISDGRSTSSANSDFIHAATVLQERGIPLMILATGTDAVDPELQIQEIVGNRTIAKSERQPFTVRLQSRMLSGHTLHLTVHNEDNVLLNERTFTLPSINSTDSAQATQLHTHQETIDVTIHDQGDHTLTFNLRTVPTPPPHTHIPATPALSSSVSTDVHVSERTLRILMLAHHPRYEMRYLRNALDRDHTVSIHSYLADGRWRRWGADRYGPETLPLSSDELSNYDALIIGDISGSALSIPAQENIVRAVRQHGMGLIWIPGERGAIADFRNTALGKIIPARLPDRDSIQRGYLQGTVHLVRSTDLGRHILNAGNLDWQQLPALIGSCPISGDPQAGAHVLLTGNDATPLVISRPYGTGRSTLLLIDDTWRWRKNVGDFYLHRFHSSLLRHASSGKQLHRQPWALSLTPSRVRIGDMFAISVAPTGALEESELLPDSITLALHTGNTRTIIRLHRAPNDTSYGISTSLMRAGTWKITIADGLPHDALRSAELTVLASTAENSDPRSNLPALQTLAQATGGEVFTDPHALAHAIRDYQHRSSSSRIQSTWDSLWFLLCIISLLSCEWAIRRHFRLP